MTESAELESRRAELRDAVDAVQSKGGAAPEIGMILGTGLGGAAAGVEVEVELDCAELPHFPVGSVSSHAGRLVLGRLGGRSVAVLRGRAHAYEGFSLAEATFPLRVLRRLGAGSVILCGAAGAIHPLWELGDVVVLDDHLNLLGDNPLIGPNLDELGPRFPDLSQPYDPELQELAEQVGLEQGAPVQRGVYACVLGPNLETRAEYRMLRLLGADVVGMSMVPEVVVARHMGMRVLALAVVTNVCLPDALEPASIEEVIRVAREAEPTLAALVQGVVERLPA